MLTRNLISLTGFSTIYLYLYDISLVAFFLDHPEGHGMMLCFRKLARCISGWLVCLLGGLLRLWNEVTIRLQLLGWYALNL